MMRTITQYEARDGSTHETERLCREHEAALDGRHHPCPKCGTSGFVQGKPIINWERDLVSEGYMGQFAQPQFMDVVVGHEKDPCDVCNGVGWTKEPKRPITRTEVVGYE